ncbi:MFS transporter [Paenibacillus campi]|uniref:MDR family MFS transporter n=1 Tax=Paenibacillus campi TaxID=3106031 RepID=UPI002AFF093C|nr:MFS transporter [Paenibacillus sp. SGZ-1009]
MIAKNLAMIHPLAWTIIVGTMFGRLVTSMSVPFLAIYLTSTLHVPATQTGLIIAGSSLAGVLVSFYGGYISDRIGRKKVMLVSVCCWSFVFFGFAAAEYVWMFFVVNVLNGICRSTFEPAARALLSDTTPPEHRLLVFNLRYAAINIGVVFGPLIGLQLGSGASTFPFFITGGVYVLYSMVLMLQFIIHPLTKLQTYKADISVKPNMREALRVTSSDRIFLPVLIGMIFCVLGYAHFDSTLAQFLAITPDITDGSKIFSYMIAMNAVVVLIVQYPLVRTARRFRPIVPLVLGNILVSLSLVMFGLAHSLPVFMIGVFIFTVGEVLMFTMMDMLIDHIAPAGWKGTYFGTMGFNNIGAMVAPVVGGMLVQHFAVYGGIIVFVPLALLTLVGMPFLLTAHRRLTKRDQEAERQATARAVDQVANL